MRINFEDIILNHNFSPKDKIFYISGNEETLINKIERFLIEKFSKIGVSQVERIGSIEERTNNKNLFFDKNLVILSGYKGINREKIEELRKDGVELMLVCANNKGDAALKKLFAKEKDLFLVNCYELNRSQKTNILNNYCKNFNIKIQKDAFWHMIEATENKFIFFENEIKKIIELNKKECSLEDIKNIVSNTVNDNFYKLFFSILKKKSDLVLLYSSSINSSSDVYRLLQVTKSCFDLIFISNNVAELESKIPKYMFMEKNNFLSIFKKTNSKNKKEIYSLIIKTEILLRKNTNQYFSIGNRFLLNVRKSVQKI
tara:strand:- start:2988 stop:3932 length:945 start_codon:yes stop_codon:yes gene_type:complete